MIFNAFWTILLGIIGGIVSSLIVSRVFLILVEYRRQFKFVDSIIRRLGAISAYLQSAQSILKVSYDQDVEIQKEMKEKGYRCEMEYYAAHADTDWISKKDVLDVFQKQINKTAQSIDDDLRNNPVEDVQLHKLIRSIITYVHKVASNKEFTFSCISQFEKDEQDVLKQYDECQKMSGRKLVKQIIKDRIMIILSIIVAVLIAGTILAFFLNI